MRDFHSVAATERVALKTSADLVSCRFAPGADRGVAADGPLGSAGGFDFLQQRGLIVLQLDDEASLHLCGGPEGFLAMHGIKGNDAVRDIEFAEQLLRGGDFVGLFLDIDVCQDETGFDVEGVQHLGRLAIGEIVEASSGVSCRRSR